MTFTTDYINRGSYFVKIFGLEVTTGTHTPNHPQTHGNKKRDCNGRAEMFNCDILFWEDFCYLNTLTVIKEKKWKTKNKNQTAFFGCLLLEIVLFILTALDCTVCILLWRSGGKIHFYRGVDQNSGRSSSAVSTSYYLCTLEQSTFIKEQSPLFLGGSISFSDIPV